MHLGSTHLSISDLGSDLYLPITMAKPRSNPSTLKGRRYHSEPHIWMQSMMEWMGQQMKSCQQPPPGRQAWVKKKNNIYPMRGNGRT
jgi:hypothetical protein